MVDALASEYGWSLKFIRDELPLCQMFALYRAICARYDQSDDIPSLEVDEMLEDMTDLRKELRNAVREFKVSRRQTIVSKRGARCPT